MKELINRKNVIKGFIIFSSLFIFVKAEAKRLRLKDGAYCTKGKDCASNYCKKIGKYKKCATKPSTNSSSSKSSNIYKRNGEKCRKDRECKSNYCNKSITYKYCAKKTCYCGWKGRSGVYPNKKQKYHGITYQCQVSSNGSVKMKPTGGFFYPASTAAIVKDCDKLKK